MPYTYPAPAPSLSGDFLTISRFLNNPTQVARRLRTLLEQRYISDALLTGRFKVEGGAVVYETGESIFPTQPPRAVTAGGEYPLTTLGNGVASLAKTTNWGEDALITDVSISRNNFDPVSRGFTKLVNQNVATVDALSLSAMSTAAVTSVAATASWSGATAAQILKDVGLRKAHMISLNQGYMPDKVVLDDTNWMYAMIAFIAAGYVPRETVSNNPAMTGSFPNILGMDWLASPNSVSSTALVVDSTQAGGMADEDLGGPGYVSAAGPQTAAVQVKTMRDDEHDQWRIRARRVTVPVVVEAAAIEKITGL